SSVAAQYLGECAMVPKSRLSGLDKVASACLLTVLAAAGAQAQTVPPDSLRGKLLTLGVNTNLVTGTSLNPQSAAQVGMFAQLMSLEVSNLPFGTSTGAFAFTFDKKLGIPTRSTQTFGPAFAQRSLTAGRGRFSFGSNLLHAHYSSFDGQNLTNGELQ